MRELQLRKGPAYTRPVVELALGRGCRPNAWKESGLESETLGRQRTPRCAPIS